MRDNVVIVRIINKFNLVAPAYMLEELKKHKEEIIQKSKLPREVIENDLDFVTENIDFISKSEYKDKIEEARKILKNHDKDIDYLALALKLNCNIFSGDKKFKQLCPDRVRNPKELLDEFMF